MHIKLFFGLLRQTRHKPFLFTLIFFAAASEALGISLLYPFLYILLEMEPKKNSMLTFLLSGLSELGLPISKYYLLLYIFMLISLKAILLLLYRYVASKNTLQYMVRLRKNIFQTIYKSYYSSITSDLSRIINAMTTQSATASGAMYLSFELLQSLFILCGMVILANILSWQIFIVALVLGVVVALIMKFPISYSATLGARLAKINEKLFNNVIQAFQNFRYLKSVASHNKFFAELHPILSKIQKTQVAFAVLNCSVGILREPLAVATLSLVLICGTVFGKNVELLAVQVYVLNRIFGSFMELSNKLQSFNNQAVSVNYCNDLQKELSAYEEKNGGFLYDALRGGIEAENIWFSFGTDKIFEDFSVSIPCQHIVVFLGDSGVGKTTFLNLITGLLKPDRGRLLIDGKDLWEYDLDSYRKHIGLVNQDSVVFNLSVRENLALRNPDVPDQVINDYIKEFGLETMFADKRIDLDYVIDENASNLSGGQRQRLALIRELIAEPQVLILDEATNALDEESKNRIIRYLNRLRGQMTIVVVTHQKEYLGIADISYVIKNGKALLLDKKEAKNIINKENFAECQTVFSKE